MTDDSNEEPPTVEIAVDWPVDTYRDAEPANMFVFTSDGRDIYFSLGFVPPIPHTRNGHHAPPERLTVEQRRSFVFTPDFVLGLSRQLAEFIERNNGFQPKQRPEGANASSDSD